MYHAMHVRHIAPRVTIIRSEYRLAKVRELAYPRGWPVLSIANRQSHLCPPLCTVVSHTSLRGRMTRVADEVLPQAR
mgnify:CR=1 FL=1